MKRLIGMIALMMVIVVLFVGCGTEEKSAGVEESTATVAPATSDTTTTTSGTTATTGTTEPKLLTEDEVKSFAFLCAGVTERRVADYKIRLTYHEERECQVYEISFAVGRIRYEYVFRATDCDIIVNNKTITETTVASK